MPENHYEERIIQLLERHPEGLTIVDIASKIKANRATVTKYIYKLYGEGKIKFRKVGAAKLCYLNKHFKKIKLFILPLFLAFLLPSLSAAQILQSHPLSEITPIDTSLNMYGYNITNVSRVGIGTASPGYPLHVVGIGYFTGNLITESSLFFGTGGPRLYASGGVIYTSAPLTLGGNLNLAGYNVTNVDVLSANLLQGALDWVNLQNYPAACGPGQAVQAIGDVLTCIDIASNSNITGVGQANYIAMWQDASTLTTSIIYQNGSNIGIGTTAPASDLDIYDSDSNVSLTIRSGVASWFHIYQPYNVNHLRISSGGGEVGTLDIITITSWGNVGIGTTSPAAKLHVEGEDVEIRLTDTGDLVWGLSTLGTSGTRRFSIRDVSNNAELLTVMQTGNVGIGTSSPGYKLDVRGMIRATDDLILSENGTQIQFGSQGGLGLASIYTTSTSNRLFITAEGVSNVAQFASYGLYLPRDVGISLYVGGDIRLGYASGTDDDTIYFDAGDKYLRWSETNNRFEFNANISAPTFIGNLTGVASDLECVDCVTLGTETVGNYVSDIIAGQGISVSGTPGEGWSPNISVVFGSTAGTAAEGNKQITINAGTGLSGGGTVTIGAGGTLTIAHADTSTQASVDNTGGVVIQDVLLDNFGHVTGLSSVDLDTRYYTKSLADSRFANVDQAETISGAWTFTNDVTFQKNIFVAGNISYVNAQTLNVNGSIIPPLDNWFDLGNSTNRWRNAYFAGTVYASAFEGSISASNVQDIWVNESGDTMTGTLTITAGGLQVTGGNVELVNLNVDSGTLYVDSLNNLVGIATTNPQHPLDVNGTLRARDLIISNKLSCEKLYTDANGNVLCGSDQQGITGSGTANYLAKFTGATTIGNSIIYDDGTNVGIGTTTPSQKLEVAGNVNITGDYLYLGNSFRFRDGNNGWLYLGTQTADYSGTGWAMANLWVASNSYLLGNIRVRGTIFNDQGVVTINDDVNINSGTLFINATNNRVGIGTTTPQYKLDVSGSVRATTDVRAPIFYDSDNTGYYVNPASTSNVNNVVVNGNLGVGIATPAKKLDVSGEALFRTTNTTKVYFDAGYKSQIYWDSANNRLVIKVV